MIFFFAFDATDIFWTITEWSKFKGKKKLDTKEFLQNQQETKILEGYKPD